MIKSCVWGSSSSVKISVTMVGESDRDLLTTGSLNQYSYIR